MDVRSGYRQTEVGLIPEDWEVVEIGECLKIRHGKSQRDVVCLSGDYPILASGGEIGRAAKPLYSKPSVLIGRKGTIDAPRYIETPFWSVDTLFYSEIFDNLSPKFLFYQFCMIDWYAYNEASGVPSLNAKTIEKILIPKPLTKAEQEAIAEALSDADANIESLKQLIDKKRQIKQGAMQELLSGKKRLRGFSGKWTTKPWGEVILGCSSGATPYRGRPDYYKGDIKWITSGELNYNVITDTIEHISIDAVKNTNLKLHPIGTFLMAITGLEAAGTRGACGIVGSPATTNQSCMAIYPTSELLTEYLYHYYVYKGEELALNYCQGTKQQSYTASLVKILPINLPPTVAEQAAISSLLSDMDAEIFILEIKLAKARQIKQGMMQELLTGRIRLI